MTDTPEPPDSYDGEEARIWAQGWNAALMYLRQDAPLEDLELDEAGDERTCGECGQDKKKVLGGWRCLNCETTENTES